MAMNANRGVPGLRDLNPREHEHLESRHISIGHHAAALPAPDELDFMQPAPFNSDAGSQMLLFRFFCFQIVLLASLAVPMSPAFAQREDMSIGDQPGYIPNAADEELPLQFRRQTVFYRSTEAPGTIIVHTAERFLYVVQPNGRAIRYGIGVGRDGFQWQGLLHITRKQEWPDWTPPPEMIERQPYLPRFMAGGPGNPMGATAPISRRRSGVRFRPDVSGWSMATSSISTSEFPLGPRLSSGRSRNCDHTMQPSEAR